MDEPDVYDFLGSFSIILPVTVLRGMTKSALEAKSADDAAYAGMHRDLFSEIAWWFVGEIPKEKVVPLICRHREWRTKNGEHFQEDADAERMEALSHLVERIFDDADLYVKALWHFGQTAFGRTRLASELAAMDWVLGSVE